MGTIGLVAAAYGVGCLVGFLVGVWYMMGEKVRH